MITYEYPLSERVRTLLRLEDLFDKVAYFSSAQGAQEHHVALVILFEILDITSRADLKFDLVQELERQRQILLSFRNNPQIAEDALSGALLEIERASTALLTMQGKIGQNLRENEWLMGIKNRVAIPGGVCEFDLPGYHFWLNRDTALRQRDLSGWIAPLVPIHDGLSIVLRLLRAAGRPETRVAEKGAYQLMLAGRTAQLVRLRLSSDETVIPEISANKYALNIRYTVPAGADPRPKQTDADISFELTFCNL
ncbi:MAG: cell division protein ZapD [Zoogloeaceae bacterium]|nr:cell division protein ZapD [Zoogloeaceae bacterium]